MEISYIARANQLIALFISVVQDLVESNQSREFLIGRPKNNFKFILVQS